MLYKLALTAILSLILASCNKKPSDLVIEQENETQHDFYIAPEENFGGPKIQNANG